MARAFVATSVRHLLVAAAVASATCMVQARPRPTPHPSPTPTATPRPRTLADLARRMRLQDQGGHGQPVLITNENLASYAARGGITTVTSTPGPDEFRLPAADGEPGLGPAGSPEDSERDMWRQRYSGQQQKVAAMESRRRELDSEIPALWNQFYAWDDPAYRDGVIKPKLDAAIRERDDLDKQIADERRKLPEILDQARRAGAEPGWFRDLRQAAPSPAPSPAP